MQLERVRAIAMCGLLLEVAGKIDDGNSTEWTLAHTQTATNAQMLTDKRRLTRALHFNAQLALLHHRTGTFAVLWKKKTQVSNRTEQPQYHHQQLDRRRPDGQSNAKHTQRSAATKNEQRSEKPSIMYSYLATLLRLTPIAHNRNTSELVLCGAALLVVVALGRHRVGWLQGLLVHVVERRIVEQRKAAKKKPTHEKAHQRGFTRRNVFFSCSHVATRHRACPKFWEHTIFGSPIERVTVCA
jgi:hypothetical protein